jgi:hypothetical protein
MEAHFNSFHLKRRKVCLHCTSTFSQQAGLNKNMRDKHAGIQVINLNHVRQCGIDECTTSCTAKRRMEQHQKSVHFVMVSKATTFLLQSSTEMTALKAVLSNPDHFSRVIPGFMNEPQPPELVPITADTPQLLPAILRTVNDWAPVPQATCLSTGEPVTRRKVLYVHLVLDALDVELPSRPWSYSELHTFFRDHFFGAAFLELHRVWLATYSPSVFHFLCENTGSRREP